MIAESMTMHVLRVMFLALTPIERWGAAKQSFGDSSSGGWIIIFAAVAQITSLMLVFWLIARNRRLGHGRRQEIARLAATNEELQQEIAELSQQTPAHASEKMQSEELEGSEEPVAIQEDQRHISQAGRNSTI